MRDERWDQLSDATWRDFAIAWIEELRGNTEVMVPDLPDLFEDGTPQDAGQFVVQMNFTASPESQWRFIEAAFEVAGEEELGDLAAGPIEHLLSTHGEGCIERVEARAKAEPRFAMMLGKCYRHGMSDAVWERLCAVRIKGIDK